MEAMNNQNIHSLSDAREARIDQAHTSENQNLRQMAQDIYNDIYAVFDKERELLRTEMQEKLENAKMGITTSSIGISCMVLACFTFTALAVVALNYVMDLWLSALIVGAVLAVAGVLLFNSGKKKLERDSLTPRRSLNTLGNIGRSFKEKYYDIRH